MRDLRRSTMEPLGWRLQVPTKAEQLARCHRELAELKQLAASIESPLAWLCALGEADWLAEIHLIEVELA